MSVAIAVGSAVSFPDFSFPRFLETASARPLQEDWGDFARPTMHNSRFCNCVSSSLPKRICMCIIWPVFAILLLVHYNLIADCGLT